MTNRLSKTISDEKLNRIIQIESAGNPDARPKRRDGTFASTAGGLGQFLVGTWQATGLKHYPDEVRHAGTAWAAKRLGKENAPLQLRMLARFCEDNARIMGSTRDGDLYLAHFLGAGAARAVVQADQSAQVTAVIPNGRAAAEANPTIIPGRTCAELRAWADREMATRWERGGRKDWVGIWLGDGRPLPPPAPDPAPTAKPPLPIGKAVVAGAGAGGAGAAGAAAAGYDWTTILTLGGMLGVTAVALFFIIRAARRSS